TREPCSSTLPTVSSRNARGPASPRKTFTSGRKSNRFITSREIVGRSPALLGALEKVNRVAKTDTTVIITGETGTGKELIARAIHSASHRHEKPLIKVNCATLPVASVESELFGHEKGAFSGAISRRMGRFELANG